MQRDRISKYSWSVRGLLPGRQRLPCSFAKVHSQGARWVMRLRTSFMDGRELAALRRLTDAGHELLPEAGAQRTLEAVSSRPLFGWAGALGALPPPAPMPGPLRADVRS